MRIWGSRQEPVVLEALGRQAHGLVLALHLGDALCVGARGRERAKGDTPGPGENSGHERFPWKRDLQGEGGGGGVRGAGGLGG